MSINTTNTIYTWSPIDYSETNLAGYMNIIFWNEGMCLIGMSDDHKVIQVKHMEWGAKFSAEALEELLLDEPMLGGDEQVKKIWIASAQNMIVPKQLFDTAQIESWFRKIFFLDINQQLEISHLSNPAGYSVDAIQTDLLQVINLNTNEAPCIGLYSCLLDNFASSKCNIGIIFIGQNAVFIGANQDQLQVIQWTLGTEAQLLHLIHEYAQKVSISQTDINILIQGYSEQLEGISASLQEYFSVTIVAIQDDFFNKLAACE